MQMTTPSTLFDSDVTAKSGRPSPDSLAALGIVLCSYRADSSALSGWCRAVAAHACQSIDSDGLWESVYFLDHGGQCCWQLHLLPDTDFLAWDRLLTRVPVIRESRVPMKLTDRLWQHAARLLRGQHWRMCALRLDVIDDGCELAASCVGLSTIGILAAARIAVRNGVSIH
jgi:hypothetical protein